MWSFPSFSLEAVSQEQLKRAAAQGDGDAYDKMAEIEQRYQEEGRQAGARQLQHP